MLRMKWSLPVFALLAASSAAAADRSTTKVALPGMDKTAWFLCDVLNAPAAVIVGKPGPDGKAAIALVSKDGTAPPVVKLYGIGHADPGAGQMYWPLTRWGKEAGNLHAFNPGMADPGAVTTPSFTSMRLGSAQYECRWLAHTRLIGIGAKRSFVVREGRNGKLVYESFDYGATRPPQRPDGVQRTTVPSTHVEPGIETSDGKGGTLMRFARRGYFYLVHLPAAGQAWVQVTRGGKSLSREPLLAWTFAPRS